MPQGQRTLTEVDGVVEIGPVGPATQKEVERKWRQRRPTPRASVRAAEGRQQHSQQQPVALLVATLAYCCPKGRSDRQPAATAAQQGGSRGALRLDREGECPGTVAFISCLDSENLIRI